MPGFLSLKTAAKCTSIALGKFSTISRYTVEGQGKKNRSRCSQIAPTVPTRWRLEMDKSVIVIFSPVTKVAASNLQHKYHLLACSLDTAHPHVWMALVTDWLSNGDTRMKWVTVSTHLFECILHWRGYRRLSQENIPERQNLREVSEHPILSRIHHSRFESGWWDRIWFYVPLSCFLEGNIYSSRTWPSRVLSWALWRGGEE